MEINYLEDDDEPTAVSFSGRPRLPQREEKVPAPRQGLPSGPRRTVAWYVCATEACSRYGYVATGPNPEELVHQVRWGRCKQCRGLGIDLEEGGNPCEPCRASGRIALKEWDEPPTVGCPFCQRPMMFMEKGMQPEGYPRMSTSHSDEEGDFSGQVSFGRTRKVE